MTTHPSVWISSVSLLTGAAVVAGDVVAEGVGPTGVGLPTLVNVCKKKIISLHSPPRDPRTQPVQQCTEFFTSPQTPKRCWGKGLGGGG